MNNPTATCPDERTEILQTRRQVPATLIFFAMVLGLLATACGGGLAQGTMARIEQKAEIAKKGVIKKKLAGEDVSPLLELMGNFVDGRHDSDGKRIAMQ